MKSGDGARGTPGEQGGFIPAVDLASEYAALRPEIDAAVKRVLSSGRYVGGPEVEAFEKEFAAFCGAGHAVAVASGTDALRFALLATGPEGGERRPGGEPAEVVTSPLTFVATTEAISQAGGRPVFVDIDPLTFNLDPALLERALTPRTRAIVPVHLYGQTADMDPILLLARRSGAAVIEDACQAHGALYRGRPAGALGDAGCFSFYPTKNLGACGEGGLVTTASGEVAGRVRRLRDHGQSEKYRHLEEGYNGRLDALQAAILGVKLRHLGAWNERRRLLADRYKTNLRDLEAKGDELALPAEAAWARHAYHLFTVRLKRRDRAREALRERGIEAGMHYPVPLHLQPCYAWMGLRAGSFPEAERAAREVLSLPLHPGMTEAQVDRVCKALRAAVDAG
ncbi:MAG: DegT/DnrJ/EryC1/StrS family aminotransferase [Acidobacteria bacterium]|nr:DegT/DnrJ/EryC1/StrS family aminotransferase [Acidobacteriota bacterium]